MSTGRQPDAGRQREPEDRSACTPCRATGTLISGKGGEPHRVTCPWCGGDGRFHPGRDAQAGAPSDGQAEDGN